MTSLIFTFGLAFVISQETLPMIRRWARRRGQMDMPDARKLHATPVPRLGGVGIFLAVTTPLLLFGNLDQKLVGLLLGALVIFGAGLINDLYGLEPKSKFLGQALACLTAVLVGGLQINTLGNLFGGGELHLTGHTATAFTVFAVVGVSNALNMIDGLDGLSSGIGMIACVAFAFLGMQSGDSFTVLTSLALLGALLGFFRYNRTPARLFMGDSGSLLLGYLLGFMAVHLTQSAPAAVTPTVPLVILAVPLFDALRVTARRLLRGGNPFRPDRSHIHHCLLDLGLEQQAVVMTLYCFSTGTALLGIVSQNLSDHVLLMLLASGGMLCTLGISGLRAVRQAGQKGWRGLAPGKASSGVFTATEQRSRHEGRRN